MVNRMYFPDNFQKGSIKNWQLILFFLHTKVENQCITIRYRVYMEILW
jgi:hypothetical protein